MLVLTRLVGEEIVIEVGGEKIAVKLVSNDRLGRAKIGVTASQSVQIHRREVYDAIERQRKGDRSA